MNKRNRIVAVVAALTALTIVFIWTNSLQGPDASSTQSAWVLHVIQPLLEPFVGQGNVTGHLIRKLAHFTEFGVLGCELAVLVALRKRRGLQPLVNCLFATLTVAVLDETIQLFTQRGSQVRDVVLDFSGAVTGLLFGLLLCRLVTVLARKRNTNKKEHPP